MVNRNQSASSGTQIVAGIVIAIVLLMLLLGNNDSGSTNQTPSTNRSYDSSSTSEENREMVRDQMIRQGADPTEAEVFTRELYDAEREHRRQHGSP